jgi:hypothetical protein
VLDLFEEFRALVEALDRSAVEFAVCGGLAMAIHARPRATLDVDLLVPTEALDGAKAVARACGYAVDGGRMALAGGRVAIHRLSKPDPETSDLDLLEVTPAVREAWVGRQTVAWEHGTIRVVSADRARRDEAPARQRAGPGRHPLARGRRWRSLTCRRAP